MRGAHRLPCVAPLGAARSARGRTGSGTSSEGERRPEPFSLESSSLADPESGGGAGGGADGTGGGADGGADGGGGGGIDCDGGGVGVLAGDSLMVAWSAFISRTLARAPCLSPDVRSATASSLSAFTRAATSARSMGERRRQAHTCVGRHSAGRALRQDTWRVRYSGSTATAVRSGRVVATGAKSSRRPHCH